jgi:ABC-2 type transport system permease protein
MIGKILGIALVGLTQFVLWILLSFLIITGFQVFEPDKFAFKESPQMIIQNKGLTQTETEHIQVAEQIDLDQGNKIIEGFNAINFDVIIGMFLFFLFLAIAIRSNVCSHWFGC